MLEEAEAAGRAAAAAARGEGGEGGEGGDAPAPPPPPPAVIVSDRHGAWTKERFDGGLADAENAWAELGAAFASVLFARDRAGGAAGAAGGDGWRKVRSYGLPSAVAEIERRFRDEFLPELFPCGGAGRGGMLLAGGALARGGGVDDDECAHVGLCDTGFDFNFPVAPLLLPERRLDLIVVVDSSEYNPQGDSPTCDWDRAARYARDRRLPLPPTFEPAAIFDQPFAVFDGAAPPADGATADAAKPATLAVMHLRRTAVDPPDGFNPCENAAEGGFCSVYTARYEPEEFDQLFEFVRQRFLAAVPKLKTAVAEVVNRKAKRRAGAL